MTSHAVTQEIRMMRADWRASDDEYRAHPVAMCGGFRGRSTETLTACLNVAHHTDWLCNGCRKRAASRRRKGASR